MEKSLKDQPRPAAEREENCLTCRFMGNQSGLRVCRRSPPIVALVGPGQGVAMLPPVGLDDWCGEWKPVSKSLS